MDPWTFAQIRIPAAPLLDIHEVAKLVGVSDKTIRRRVRAGEFPPPNRDGRWTSMAVGAWLLWQDYGPRQAEVPEVEIDAEDDEEGDGEPALAARRRPRPADK